jgi:chromate reductase
MIINILCMSGSLRSASTNAALLGAAKILAPAEFDVRIWDGLGDLPHFNPDFEGEAIPKSVIEFRKLAGSCDAIIIACPEYARGIPGAFKNALDWLVGSETFFDRRVALFNASPRASAAQDALRLVLTTMAAQIVETACIAVPLISKSMTAQEIANDQDMSKKINMALTNLSFAIAQRHIEQLD